MKCLKSAVLCALLSHAAGALAAGGGLAATAMQYELYRTSDLKPLIYQAVALELRNEGLTESEIVIETHQWRREYGHLIDDVFEQPGPAAGYLGLGLVKALALEMSRPIAAAGGYIPDRNRALEFLELYVDDDSPMTREVQKAFIEIASDTDLVEHDNPFVPIVKHYREDATYRQAWNLLFKGVYGHTPGDPDETILEVYPDLFDESSTLGRLVRAETGEIPTEELGWIVGQAMEDTAKGTAAAGTTRLTFSGRAGMDIGNGLTVISRGIDLIGAVDRPLSRRLRATADAAWTIAVATDRFKLARSIGANVSLAAVAAFGNVAGALARVVTTFMGSGPSATEQMLRHLAIIGNQLRTLRAEIDEEFTILHQRFDRLQTQVAALAARTIRNHSQVAADLDRLAADHRALSRGQIESDNENYAVEVELGLELRGCFRPYEPAQGDEMGLTRYRDCHAGMLGLLRQLPMRQRSSLIDEFRGVDFAFERFRSALSAMGENAPIDPETLPAAVVSPEDLVRMLRMLDDLVTDHGDLYTLPASQVREYVAVAHAFRAALRQAVQAVREDIERLAGGERSVLWETLDIQVVEAIDSELDDAIERAQGGSDTPYDLTAGPFAWEPLKGTRLPSWLTIGRGISSCPLHYAGGVRFHRFGDFPRSRALFDPSSLLWAFKPRYLNDYIHPHDQVLARAGLGRFAICFYRQSYRNRNQQPRVKASIVLWFIPRVAKDFNIGRPLLWSSSLARFRRNESFLSSAEAVVLLSMGRHARQPAQALADVREVHKEKVTERTAALHAYLSAELGSSAVIDEIDRRIAEANTLIARWLHLAGLDGAGRLALPKISELIAESSALQHPIWQINDRFAARRQAVLDALSSPEMQELLTTEHPLLEGLAYRYLDYEP